MNSGGMCDLKAPGIWGTGRLKKREGREDIAIELSLLARFAEGGLCWHHLGVCQEFETAPNWKNRALEYYQNTFLQRNHVKFDQFPQKLIDSNDVHGKFSEHSGSLFMLPSL